MYRSHNKGNEGIFDDGSVPRADDNTITESSAINHLNSNAADTDSMPINTIDFGEFMDSEINPNKVKHAICGTLITR